MRGAFGKPLGTVARVKIGQPIMSVRCKDTQKATAIEALRRAKFKFPGRQKVNNLHNTCIYISVNLYNYIILLDVKCIFNVSSEIQDYFSRHDIFKYIYLHLPAMKSCAEIFPNFIKSSHVFNMCYQQCHNVGQIVN